MDGIDVSRFQGTIDWAAVKATGSVDFVIAKATEGLSLVDDQFARNLSVCKERGIPIGAYHFFHPHSDPKAQADHFLSVVDVDDLDILPAVDVELSDNVAQAGIVQALSTFIQAIEKKTNGKRMLLYTFYSFWNDTMHGSDAFSGHPLWLAEYNQDPSPTLPLGFSNYAIWQYSKTGNIDGIAGDVDLNRLSSDSLLDIGTLRR